MSRKNRSWASRPLEYKKRHIHRRKKPYNTAQEAGLKAAVYAVNFKKLYSVYECDVCAKYHLKESFA